MNITCLFRTWPYSCIWLRNIMAYQRFLGYLIPNPLYTYISNIRFVFSTYQSLSVTHCQKRIIYIYIYIYIYMCVCVCVCVCMCVCVCFCVREICKNLLLITSLNDPKLILLLTVAEGDQKAPFSIATTLRG